MVCGDLRLPGILNASYFERNSPIDRVLVLQYRMSKYILLSIVSFTAEVFKFCNKRVYHFLPLKIVIIDGYTF